MKNRVKSTTFWVDYVPQVENTVRFYENMHDEILPNILCDLCHKWKSRWKLLQKHALFGGEIVPKWEIDENAVQFVWF